ncbi:DUF1127 domain-containing protein [Rhizobium leguminosarum]|uniref:DUF1127 domain-containing protein n=1 Tax=Rhizobium leguminosarum TaxID=384 RepID=UPI00027D80C3|nr:DUF1127 domain-containing protein [Rhizobium leguminosarum]RWY81364.1 DUF1127 domain-containing protein [Rhizobium leguminosarum]TAV49422.1 DUF1127 domain-containing protein [Rhizobium leguminosarum]TAV58785.1 DUF1127 domain-containing protein [Rhizobium leguminosarum]TAV69833.1 DUF1127 domain-containing protein [Rhizobium leguminosarum]TAY67494.1 DUF1127 domain-containing protein [Rhizobium leguminosarum]
MAHTETHAGIGAPERQAFGSWPNSVATIVAALRAWRRVVVRRKALAELTPDQLRDIGHAQDIRPVLEIKAGLMTKLMSMR